MRDFSGAWMLRRRPLSRCRSRGSPTETALAEILPESAAGQKNEATMQVYRVGGGQQFSLIKFSNLDGADGLVEQSAACCGVEV